MTCYNSSWIPMPQQEYEIMQQSLSEYMYHDAESYVEHIFMILVALIALVINILVLVVGLRSPSIRSSNSGILTLKMALVDCTRVIVIGYSILLFFVNGKVAENPDMCLLESFLSGLLTGITLLTTTLSAVDRYMTIVRKRIISKIQIWQCVIGIWVGSILFTCLPLFAARQSYYQARISGIYCGYAFYDRSNAGIALTLASLFYLGLPVQAIQFCYGAIIKSYVAVRIQNGRFEIHGKEITHPNKLTLWQIHKLIQDMGQEQSMSVYMRTTRAPSTDKALQESKMDLSSQLSSRQRMELLVFRKSLISFASFNVCWLPFTLMTITELISGKPVPRIWDFLGIFGAVCNCFINGFLHFLLDERFKVGLRELFYK